MNLKNPYAYQELSLQRHLQHPERKHVLMAILNFAILISLSMRLKRFLLPLIVLFFSSLTSVQAQKEGYLEVLGFVLAESKGIEGASIKVLKGDENVDNFLSSSGGKFIINLDLDHL